MKAILFAVAAGLFWGCGEVATRSVMHSKAIGPMTVLLVRTFVAIPPIILAWALAAHIWRLPTEPKAWVSNMTPDLWLKLIIGSGIVAGGLGVTCFYAAISLGEISRIKPIAFAVAPATAVLLGWLLLGESMSMRKALAVMMILSGVVLLTGAPRATPAPQPDSTHTG